MCQAKQSAEIETDDSLGDINLSACLLGLLGQLEYLVREPYLVEREWDHWQLVSILPADNDPVLLRRNGQELNLLDEGLGEDNAEDVGKACFFKRDCLRVL